ncbi:glutamine amidotransferase [Anaeromyxobacter diazotrophicus]|uniref:GMP synthase n=1 Tax=Anaeromyxobacter diazotrophicus TaxID=2590199 RepID=A0A7I9VT16_9BACT|nr:glutamine amidotransferase [Anaeromyxobacter diazotrophicus]GEJ59368.1 GMP synthase [Anaeromyxobacter diazotrophicus]
MSHRQRRVLLLQAGSAPAALRARFGDFPDWFARHLAPRVELEVVRPYERALPSPSRFHGVLVTGSLASVTDPAPWMDEAGAWLVDAARAIPVLGVCFGHQLLARALGGRVELNPRGREAGTVEVQLTAAGARDPLFAGLPARLLAQETHEDHVAELPPGATLLAGNARTPVQAFGVGERLRCVQFHPEFDQARSRHLAELRRAAGEAAAWGDVDPAAVRETPEATAVLGRWLDHFVGAR